MITTQEIEKALHFLIDSAKEAAQSRANRIYLEEFRKSLKAQIMSQHQDLPVNAQEREAYKNVEYIAHLQTMKDAIQEDEKMRFLIEAAKVKISVWQTMAKMDIHV
jgi:ABC-type transport system involved in cytochrome c biogenesis ATPase subunit